MPERLPLAEYALGTARVPALAVWSAESAPGERQDSPQSGQVVEPEVALGPQGTGALVEPAHRIPIGLA